MLFYLRITSKVLSECLLTELPRTLHLARLVLLLGASFARLVSPCQLHAARAVRLDYVRYNYNSALLGV